MLHIAHSVPKKISIVFNNGSNYDYHFIMKELAAEFKKQFTYLGKNTEKYITFTVLTEKVTRIDKNGEEITKNISHILQFIDSARFTASSLSNLVFLKKFVELNINTDMLIKNVKHGELNISIATAFLNIQILKII